MKFGSIDVRRAEGAILAHSLRTRDRVFRKGRVLSGEDLIVLRAAGHARVTAARLGPNDVHEDEAARRVAAAIAGPGARLSAPFTGRANLFAEADGVALIDTDRLRRINLVHEAVTVATVERHAVVGRDQMLATVKVIPFAAPRRVVERCCALAAERGVVSVAAFRGFSIGLVLTRLEGTKESVLDRTVQTLSDRVGATGGHLAPEVRCRHDAGEVAEAVRTLLGRGADIVLVYGASAIVDRRDVIPAGILKAGGKVVHFGMPVDPGNLMLLAQVGDRPVLGLPGCARSPKLNGFDWVFERLMAGIEVTRRDLMTMGAGGLLKEIPSRPTPRAGSAETATVKRAPRIGALVLAAGQSRRMGPVNKLLATVDGAPLVAHTVEAVLASAARPVVVILGHEADRVRAALLGRDVTFIANPDYAEGLSASLRHGLAAMPAGVDGALVCLGDMPVVSAALIDKLIAAFDPIEGRAICVPTYRGKRGNPVLWAARFFEEMRALAGDVGARHLIGEHADLVCEVATGEEGILMDVDTPEALAGLSAPGDVGS